MEKHSFPLQEEATEQTPRMIFRSPFQLLTVFAILAAILSSVKQGKLFPQRTLLLNTSASFPCPQPFR